MKNNQLTFYIICTLFVFVNSCSFKSSRYKKGDVEKMTTHFPSKENKRILNRKIASEGTPTCFGAEINVEKLLKEIENLENSREVGSRSLLAGMDLSKFPPSQASFLQKNISYVHTEGLDLSECNDLKCVYGKIYNSDGIEGYLIYYFYLKMGYIISAERNIPQINFPPALSLNSFLFTRDELYSFYLLTKLLNPHFEKLSTLKSFHRMPNNYLFPNQSQKACGLAGGRLDGGWVILTKDCLGRELPSLLNGGFFSTTTHEIVHRLDYLILPKNEEYSESDEWLDFSGWYVAENINPQTRKVERSWAKKSDANQLLKYDKFVRDYAETQPGEDFAESVAYYRVKPDLLKKVGPRKYEWISKKLYGSKQYLSEHLGDNYVESMRIRVLDQVPSIVDKCVANADTFSPHMIDQNEFPGYDPSLVACIGGGLSVYLDDAINVLKDDEAEFCSVMKKSEDNLKSRALKGLTEFIKKDLDSNIHMAQQMKIFGEFLAKLKDNLDPREVFMACLSDQAPAACFDKEIVAAFEAIAMDYQGQISSQVKSYEEIFLKENNFADTKSKMISLFQQIFSRVDLKFNEEASKRWESCKSNLPISAEGELILWPYDGGTHYIKKDLLNCLNRNALIDLGAVIDKFGKRLGIVLADDSARKFVIDLYINSFITSLQTRVADALKKEEENLNALKINLKTKSLATLTQDLSWFPVDSQATTSGKESCLQKENELIASETVNLDKNWDYFIFDKVTSEWAESICAEIMSSPALKNRTQRYRSDTVNAALPQLDTLVLQHSTSVAEGCRKLTSRKDKVSSSARKVCLTNYLTWKNIIDKALQDWVSSLDGGLRDEAQIKGAAYLKAKNSILQSAAVNQMNAK